MIVVKIGLLRTANRVLNEIDARSRSTKNYTSRTERENAVEYKYTIVHAYNCEQRNRGLGRPCGDAASLAGDRCERRTGL